MKCDKIAIEFDTTTPEKVTLVDFPAYCEIVHVSGEAPEMGPGVAHLHINTADNPTKARKPMAFLVVADGVDIPGYVIPKKGRETSGHPSGCSDSDEVEPTFVRRVGKFTTPSGALFFVFERL